MKKHTSSGKQRLALLSVLVALAVLVSACSNSNDNATPTSTTAETAAHNAQDVTFATNMVPHHGQAIQMAKLVQINGSNAQVKDLAKRIEAAQQPEIDKMNGWLTSWGEPKADVDMPMGEHSSHGMSGMMSSRDMNKLMAAHNVDFDRMFLQMMIEHHKGAIEMANTEKAKGQFADAKAMAESIAMSQQAEITEMQNLLTQLR